MAEFNTSVAEPVGGQAPPPVQYSDPLDAIMKYRQQKLALAAGQQQLAAGQQEFQTGALKQQELQMNLDQRKAINDAYKAAFSPQADGSVQLDTGKLTSALSAAGYGEAVPAIMEAHTKYQKSLADLHETNQKVALAEHDAAGMLAATVQAASNDPALFHTLTTDAMNRGIVPRAEYAPIDQAIQQALQQDPSGEKARALVKQLTDQMLAGSPKQQELASQRKTAEGAAARGAAATRQADVAELRETREASKPAAEHNTTEAQLAADATDPAKTPAQQAAASAALKRLDQSKLAARPVVNVGIPGLNPAQLTANPQLTGEEYLATLPASFADQVRGTAEGRLTMPTANARTPAAQQLRTAVMRYDPQFSEQRAQVRKAFTTGPDGRNVRNLNTATVHLDQLGEAATAMGNGSFQPGNQVWNRVVTMFGGSAPTNFAGLKTAVAGEMANALKGVATDPEIAEINKAISSTSSPQQLAGIVDTHLHVLGAKLRTYSEAYQQQLPGDKWSPVLPSARTVFAKHGFDPLASEGGAPASQGGTAKAPAMPAVLSQADVGKTYLSRAGKLLKVTAVNPKDGKQFKADEVK